MRGGGGLLITFGRASCRWLKIVAEFFCRIFGALVNNNNNSSVVPLSVNYHFTRQCNYKCGFCFHTAKTSFVLPLQEAKRGLKLLHENGMKKINFSGGEPFIEQSGKYLGELVKYCKLELPGLSVSIVSNGSLIKESWMKKYGQYVDILAISCDSFDEQTNRIIGRYQGHQKDHISNLKKVHKWCNEYVIAFKINTVVNIYNIDEDFSEHIHFLNPIRWKVFQCLLLEGENVGENALRDAKKFYISNDQFEHFIKRHSHLNCLVSESNKKMRDSYIILDEHMRFLNCQKGGKEASPSLLDVGVKHALNYSGFDEEMFQKRGGVYNWNKCDMDQFDW